MTKQTEKHNESSIASALLSCPFCGGEPLLYPVGDEQCDFNIQCKGCNADLDAWNTKELTIAQWNTRHDSAELADLRMKLAAVRECLRNIYACSADSDIDRYTNQALAIIDRGAK